MSKAMTVAEAKARFSECVKATEDGETVLITRYGQATTALVSARYLADLQAAGRKGPAQQGLAALVGRFPDGEELAAEVERTGRRRSATRRSPKLG